MLLKPKYLARFRQVATVLIRHGFSDVLAALDLQRFLPGREPAHTTEVERQQQRARSLREALEELGPTYIKLGQVLSTRPDVLPTAYIEELEQLQDQVEPFPFADVRRAVEEELDRPLEQVFLSFDEKPVASASLAQVHVATLARPAVAAPGIPVEETFLVAVKVLRPAVEEEVSVDLEILAEVAHFVRRSALAAKYDFTGIVEQLARTLKDEVDLTREARNAEHAAESVREYPLLRVPAVIDELTTRRIHVAEFIDGTRLRDLDPAGARAGPELAEQLWRAYLKRILVEGTFHCDPHPGNFLIDRQGRIALLDHGMVAHLTRETQIRLMALLLALADRDGDEVASACLELGFPGPGFRHRKFQTDIALVVARSSSLPLGELGFGHVLVDLVRVAFADDIQIPSELMLLGKTLLNLEGVCRRLDPGMDPVSIMREMASSLLTRQIGRDLTLNKALAASLEVRSLAREGPASLRRILRRAAANEFRIGIKLEGEAELEAAIQKIASRITLGIITAALIMGSALLLNVRAGWIMIFGYPVFAMAGFVLAFGLGIYLVTKIILADKY